MNQRVVRVIGKSLWLRIKSTGSPTSFDLNPQDHLPDPLYFRTYHCARCPTIPKSSISTAKPSTRGIMFSPGFAAGHTRERCVTTALLPQNFFRSSSTPDLVVICRELGRGNHHRRTASRGKICEASPEGRRGAQSHLDNLLSNPNEAY